MLFIIISIGIINLITISINFKPVNNINITISVITEYNNTLFYSISTSLSSIKQSNQVMTIPSHLLDNLNSNYIFIVVKVDDMIFIINIK